MTHKKKVIAIRETPYIKFWRYEDHSINSQIKRLNREEIALFDKIGISPEIRQKMLQYAKKDPIQLVKWVKNEFNLGLFETSLLLKAVNLWSPSWNRWKYR